MQVSSLGVWDRVVCEFTHFRADLRGVPPSSLGYALECAPSLISRQARQLDSVRTPKIVSDREHKQLGEWGADFMKAGEFTCRLGSCGMRIYPPSGRVAGCSSLLICLCSNEGILVYCWVRVVLHQAAKVSVFL